MNSVCIFLGSSPGVHPDYAAATSRLGRELARRGLTCVYGGSDTGLMKLLADSVLEAGGRVVGVTVTALKDREIYHPDLTELHVVETMHERKRMMADRADAFIALPGGIGTFEELFEVYTWAKLGFHAKPCALLDVRNYYAPLEALLDNAEREGFLASADRDLLVRGSDVAELLDRLAVAADGRA